MLEPGILQAMTDAQLIGEIQRVRLMQTRVTEYLETVIAILSHNR